MPNMPYEEMMRRLRSVHAIHLQNVRTLEKAQLTNTAVQVEIDALAIEQAIRMLEECMQTLGATE